jgi:hypothetical protein
MGGGLEPNYGKLCRLLQGKLRTIDSRSTKCSPLGRPVPEKDSNGHATNPRGSDNGRRIIDSREARDVFVVSLGGVRQSTWYVGHCWPIVPAPDDR